MRDKDSGMQKTGGGEIQTTGSIGKKSWHAPVLITMIGAFMSILDSSIVNVAIAPIMHVFNTNTVTIEWVVTAYALALGAVIPLSGWAGDKFGFKNVYIYSLIVFTIGSLLCSLSWSVESLIFARILQAMGGGMIMPTTIAMVTRIVPKENFGSAMGIVGISLFMAPAIGPTLGGYLVEYINWRWIFTINLPIGVIGVLLAVFYMPKFEKKSTVGKLDWGGAVTSITMLFCLLLGLNKGSEWGWKSEKIVLLFYISAVCLILFLIIELTTEEPLLDIRLFKISTFTAANVMSAVVTVGLFAGIFYIPLFLQNIRGLGAMETGLLMLPAALVSGIMMPISGKLYDKIGPKPLAVTGLLICAYATYLFHKIDVNTPNSTIILWMICRSMGLAFAQMPSQSASVSSVPQDKVGRATAINNIISRVASAFGIVVLTTFLNNHMNAYSAQMANSVNAQNIAATAFFAKLSAFLGGSASAAKVYGVTIVKGYIAQASFVRALDDLFVIAAVLSLIGAVPALFLKKNNTSANNRSSIASE